MRAHFGLPSVIAEESEGRPPIHVKFEIPYFTVSGIQVYFVIIFITITVQSSSSFNKIILNAFIESWFSAW